MSCCNTCAKQFGFWTKEYGCPRCKRVFCKNCLSHKVPESAENLRKKINVCLRCSKLPIDDVSASKPKQEKLEDILKLDDNERALEPVLEPIPTTSYADDIRERLDALKKDDIPQDLPDPNDIEKRLASLKGVEHKDYSEANKNILLSNDKRSDQEKINDLLKQFAEEKTIDDEAKPDADGPGTIEDIEKRLAALRGQDLDKMKQQIEQIEETEEEETERIMKQYLDEAKIDDIALDPDEQELVSTIPPPPGDKKELEELPFCEICNEDASLRCLECENLFCGNCYREFHDEEDYKTHKTKPYQAPKKNEF